MLVFSERVRLKKADVEAERATIQGAMPAVTSIGCLFSSVVAFYLARFLGFEVSQWFCAAAGFLGYIVMLFRTKKSTTVVRICEIASAEADATPPERHFRKMMEYIVKFVIWMFLIVEMVAFVANTLSAHTPGSPLYHQ